MLASKSSWWRPSRLYRRPRSHSRIRDSTVSDSTVLPGPSYLGLAKVHKHALSHACLCTLARPKFDPISWRPVLVASAELHSIPECTAGGSLSIRWGMVWCISPIPQDNSMVVSRCPWMKATIGSWVEACYSHRQGLEIETWNTYSLPFISWIHNSSNIGVLAAQYSLFKKEKCKKKLPHIVLGQLRFVNLISNSSYLRVSLTNHKN
jgi:hypothetical protein